MKKLEEIAFFAADVDATVRFYEKVLGLKPATWTPGRTAVFLLGDVRLFFHVRGEAMPDGPRNEDHISFAVDDVDAACEKLRREGLRIEVGPKDFYWGRSAYIRDQDGRLIELHRAPTAKR